MNIKPKSLLTPILLVLVVVTFIGAFFYVINRNSFDTSSSATVIATVNGVNISKQAVTDVTSVSKEAPKAVEDKLIKTEILGQYLTKTGFTVTPDEILKNIKAGEKTNANTKLNSKLNLISRKIKAYYQLDDQGLDKKYSELKSAAKITIHVQL